VLGAPATAESLRAYLHDGRHTGSQMISR
jgi:hypothetical protein